LTRGTPSRFAERLVWLLLPPPYREPVLGDLRERYESPVQYFFDAVFVIPCVLASRIRRSTNPGVLLMEALVLYLSFFTTAKFTRPESFFSVENGMVRLVLPTAVALLGFVLVDAYSNPEKHGPLKPALQTVLAMSFAFLSQASLVTSPGLAVPFEVLVAGCAMSLLVISALRMLFDSGDRPAGAA
jgi:hypothetical protein